MGVDPCPARSVDSLRALVLLSSLVLAIAASGCMGGATKVSATDNAFTPNSANAKQNEEFSWKNDGENLHSVTIHKVGDPVTTTKKDTDIAKGTSTAYKFEETGTYHVYCKYHSGGAAGQFGSGMVMTVTVAA
jgi:plastocyanin